MVYGVNTHTLAHRVPPLHRQGCQYKISYENTMPTVHTDARIQARARKFYLTNGRQSSFHVWIQQRKMAEFNAHIRIHSRCINRISTSTVLCVPFDFICVYVMGWPLRIETKFFLYSQWSRISNVIFRNELIFVFILSEANYWRWNYVVSILKSISKGNFFRNRN